MDLEQTRDFLLFALNHFALKVERQEENTLYLEKGYQIEIENPSLFKLMHDQSVIAPFGDIEELCQFILMDVKQNE